MNTKKNGSGSVSLPDPFDSIGGAEWDRTVGLSIRSALPSGNILRNYNTPILFSSNLPLTDLKYLSLEAVSDLVPYFSL